MSAKIRQLWPCPTREQFRKTVAADMAIHNEEHEALLNSGNASVDDLLEISDFYDAIMAAWIMAHPTGPQRDLILAELNEASEQIELIRESNRQKARAILARRRNGHG